MMLKFRKKPVVIEAVLWTGDNFEDIVPFAPEVTAVHPGGRLMIETLEGIMTASPGDWVIRGVGGELYPCKPDIFEATYELVE